MKVRSFLGAASTTFTFLLLVGISADAAEIKVLSAGGMRPVMEDLGPKFERASGHKLTITFGFAGAVVKRVQSGELVDVVIVPGEGVDTLLRDGKAGAESVSVIARAGIGVAVRTGTPKPDISSPEALKRALLDAKSIAYGNPAQSASGIHFAKVLVRLGIANEMTKKTIVTQTPGEIGALVANGGTELGVNLIQDFVQTSGVEIVGPLPADLQNTVVFSAVIITGPANVGASKALVNFLRTPEAAAVIKAKGLDPASP